MSNDQKEYGCHLLQFIMCTMDSCIHLPCRLSEIFDAVTEKYVKLKEQMKGKKKKEVKKWREEGLKPILDLSFFHMEINGSKGEFTNIF